MRPDYYKQMRWIYWVVFAFLVFFGVVTLLFAPTLSQMVEWSASEIESFKTIIILLALTGIPATFILHSKRARKISASLSFHEQMRQYRAGFFIKIITLEALAILSFIGYLVTMESAFAYMSVLLIVAYLLSVPIVSKIVDEFEKPEVVEYDEDEDNEEDTE